MKKNLILSVLLLPLFACSSGGDSSTTSASTTKTGVFLDSPVINIGYKTETLSGVTGPNGEYDYLPGETVTFFIGDLELPSTLATGTVTPLTLVGSQDTSNSTVVNIIRLLQTLDSDANADNGITIPDAAQNVAVQVDFNLSIIEFENSSAVNSLIMNAGQEQPPSGLVSESEAVLHFENTLSETPLDTSETLNMPIKSILIDANDNDWAGVQPIGIDPVGDQNGNSSTDLVKASLAVSGNTIALLMKTSGNISFPHTLNRASSHYSVGFNFHNNSSCDDDNGFLIVNSFYFQDGQNYNRVEGWFGDDTLTDILNQQTNVAYSGNILEISFSLNLLPKNKGKYVSINPFINSIGQEEGDDILHDNLDANVCFRLPVQ